MPPAAAAAAVKSVPVPAWAESMLLPPGDARRRHQRCRGVPPPAHSLAARFQASNGRPISPSVIGIRFFSVCWITVAAISTLGTRGPAAGEACAAGQGLPAPPGVACRTRRGIANRSRRVPAVPPWGEACRCRSGPRRVVHAPGQACRCHRVTRGAGINAATVCRRRGTVCLLVF